MRVDFYEIKKIKLITMQILNFNSNDSSIGLSHNQTLGIETKKNKSFLSMAILGFWDLWPLVISLNSIT